MKPLFRKFPLNESIYPLIGVRTADGGAEPPAARADGKFYTESKRWLEVMGIYINPEDRRSIPIRPHRHGHKIYTARHE